jgi:hypothetical protein
MRLDLLYCRLRTPSRAEKDLPRSRSLAVPAKLMPATPRLAVLEVSYGASVFIFETSVHKNGDEWSCSGQGHGAACRDRLPTAA